MKERIVGGVVDERKESVLGVEKMECAVEEDGQETVVTGKLEDPATISAQRRRKVIKHPPGPQSNSSPS